MIFQKARLPAGLFGFCFLVFYTIELSVKGSLSAARLCCLNLHSPGPGETVGA